MHRLLLGSRIELVRAGVREFLRRRPDLVVGAEASRPEEIPDLVAVTRPVLLILGPYGEPTEVWWKRVCLSAGGARLPVICLSVDPSPDQPPSPFTGGAWRWVSLDASRTTFLTALDSVLKERGEASPTPNIPTTSTALTARERQVLALIISGRRSREIAYELRISVKTVDTHRGAIMRKFGVRRLADLVRCALEEAHRPAGGHRDERRRPV